MKTTQSKWGVKEARDNLNGFASFVSYQVVTDNGVTIAKEVTSTDARLIASAPELLTACKYALGVLESVPEEYAELIADILDESVDTGMIEDAILKAEGK